MNCDRGKKCDVDEQKKYDKVHITGAKRHLFISLEHGQKRKNN